ncbi:MAG TPA: hypothetical protein VFG45_08700 [Candidatus Nitrosocosmicus sp.]|nr:hypothetical protein [Candidatus Nitrosocosmicus sp.]
MSSSSSNSHSNDSTSYPKRITTSVALSIVSGIIILASSLFWSFFVNTTTIDQMSGFMGNTMGNHMINGDGMTNFHGLMGWMGGGGGTGVTGGGLIFLLMAIVSGVMILIGAMIMYKRPQDKKIGE